MRLTRLQLRGINTFNRQEPIDVNFDALGPGLIAITGENGEGKTTFTEAIAAALYKAFPSRPVWYEFFRGRDAFSEPTFADGDHRIQVRLQVDAEARKTERYVFVDGKSLTTGKRNEADAEILRRFGSYELYLASIHGAQSRAGNLLDAAKGERKARFAELLGLARLEALAASAHDRRGRAELALERAREDLADLDHQLEGKADDEAALDAALAGQEKAAGALETARQEETAATATLERARTAAERLASLRSAANSADQAAGEATRAVNDAEQSATRAHRTAEQRREDLRVTVARRPRLEALVAELPDLLAARDQLPALVTEQEALEEAERKLAAAQGDEQRAAGALEAAEFRRTAAKDNLARELEQLQHTAGLLEQVPCTAMRSWPLAGRKTVDLAGTCQLLADARGASQRASTLTLEPAVEKAVADAQARHDAAASAVEDATVAADPLRLAEVKAALVQLRDKAARAQAGERAQEDLDALAADEQRTSAAIEADLAEALKAAETRLKDAQARKAAACKRADEAKQALEAAATDTVTVPQADAALSAARQARIDAERTLREADKAHATAAAAIEALQTLEAARPAKQEAVQAAEEDLGDWTLLEKALGRDGIQALEIDAAGPEVARIVNELLAACYGTRWTLAFETLREKKSAPGEYTEAFDIRAFDHGEPRDVSWISGGERVIVGEALALALAIYNHMKSGLRWETLIRDEPSSALSPANAAAYADMMRRALTIGGFHQLLFVSHQREVIERADVRLVVAGGRVAVEGSGKTPAVTGAHNPSGRGPDEPVGAASPGRGKPGDAHRRQPVAG